jgi:hypothetical protein
VLAVNRFFIIDKEVVCWPRPWPCCWSRCCLGCSRNNMSKSSAGNWGSLMFTLQKTIIIIIILIQWENNDFLSLKLIFFPPYRHFLWRLTGADERIQKWNILIRRRRLMSVSGDDSERTESFLNQKEIIKFKNVWNSMWEYKLQTRYAYTV